MPNKHSTFPRSRTLQMSESNPVAGPEERTQLEESVKCSCTFAQSWQGTPRGGKQALQGGLEKMCAQTDQELLIYTGSCSAHDCAMALVDVEMCEVFLQLSISLSHFDDRATFTSFSRNLFTTYGRRSQFKEEASSPEHPLPPYRTLTLWCCSVIGFPSGQSQGTRQEPLAAAWRGGRQLGGTGQEKHGCSVPRGAARCN